MIIFIFTYKSGDSISFESRQFQTIDEAETFYFSHSLSDEIVFQTSEGGASVLSKDVVEFILKEVDDSGITIHYREYDFKMDGHVFVTKYNGDINKHYQVYEWKNNLLSEVSHTYEIDNDGKITELKEETNVVSNTNNVDNLISSVDNVTENTDINEVTIVDQNDGVDVVLPASTPSFELNDIVEEKRSSEMGDEEVIVSGDNKINQKFVGFREKYIDSENKQDSWESQIIEKMQRREQKLKEMADVLDKENEFLDKFKQDKLGV